MKPGRLECRLLIERQKKMSKSGFFSEKTEKQAEIRALFLSFSFLQLSDDALDQ